MNTKDTTEASSLAARFRRLWRGAVRWAQKTSTRMSTPQTKVSAPHRIVPRVGSYPCGQWPSRHSLLLLSILTLGASGATALWCRATDQVKAFEVVSVKRHLDPSSSSFGTVVIRLNPPKPKVSGRRYSERMASVQDLIVEAYDLRSYLIFGLPDWGKAGHEHYDVEALAPDETPTPSDLRMMLQSMLADRFQ
jgi:hypothetical protein